MVRRHPLSGKRNHYNKRRAKSSNAAFFIVDGAGGSLITLPLRLELARPFRDEVKMLQ
jgi:hypothetical protein